MLKIFALIFVIGLIFLLPASISAATLNLTPKLTPVCTYQADINLDTEGAATDATDVVLNYDPSKVSVSSINNGSIYSNYVGKNIDNNSGRLALSGLSSIGQPYSGQGTFATINYQIKAGAQVGPAALNFDFDPNNPSQTTDSNVVESGTVRELLRSVGNLFFNVGSGTAPAANSALFIKSDTGSQGNWMKVYGQSGYQVIFNLAKYPSYAQINVIGVGLTNWTTDTTDVRGLQKVIGSNRVAAAWSSNSQFTMDLDLTDGNSHEVALYMVDWDSNNTRAQKIEIFDATTNVLLDSRTVTNFSDGQYLVWSLKGHNLIRVTKTGAAEAVISGIFFN
jgi:hypothetical protein